MPIIQVSLKTSSVVSAIGSIAAVLVAAVMSLIQAGGVITLGIIWSALSLVAVRGFQVYSSMQAERSDAIQGMVGGGENPGNIIKCRLFEIGKHGISEDYDYAVQANF